MLRPVVIILFTASRTGRIRVAKAAHAEAEGIDEALRKSSPILFPHRVKSKSFRPF